MASLVAIGKNPGDRWEHELTPQPVMLGRLAESSDWATPWDLAISRRHATLVWQDGELKVRREPNALNPITIRVGNGRATPRPINKLEKIGTTHFSSAPTIRNARLTTETG